MEDSVVAATIVGLFCGISLVVFGYLIGIKHEQNLISSCDDNSYNDSKLVGFIMGLSVFITGLLISMTAVGLVLNYIFLLQALSVSGTSVVIPLVAALCVNVKYAKPD